MFEIVLNLFVCFSPVCVHLGGARGGLIMLGNILGYSKGKMFRLWFMLVKLRTQLIFYFQADWAWLGRFKYSQPKGEKPSSPPDAIFLWIISLRQRRERDVGSHCNELGRYRGRSAHGSMPLNHQELLEALQVNKPFQPFLSIFSFYSLIFFFYFLSCKLDWFLLLQKIFLSKSVGFFSFLIPYQPF